MGKDMRRHDLYAFFEEAPQQILVQVGVDDCQPDGIVGKGIDLVFYVIVIERGGHHERMGLVPDAWCFEGSRLHDFLHLLPRYVIANGDLCMDNNAVVLGGNGVVAGL